MGHFGKVESGIGCREAQKRAGYPCGVLKLEREELRETLQGPGFFKNGGSGCFFLNGGSGRCVLNSVRDAVSIVVVVVVLLLLRLLPVIIFSSLFLSSRCSFCCCSSFFSSSFGFTDK